MLSWICGVQTANSTIRGRELRAAGNAIAALAVDQRCTLMAADETGERLVGAALLADDDACVVDTSCRLDGKAVLLVAGHIAGTTGIALKASLARSLGATHVQAAFLGDASATIVGCEHVTSLDAKVLVATQDFGP